MYKNNCVYRYVQENISSIQKNFSNPNAVPYDVFNNIDKNIHFYGAMTCLEMVLYIVYIVVPKVYVAIFLYK